jgi:hypothetical protein
MMKPKRNDNPSRERRRFLGLLGGGLAAGASLALLPREEGPRERDLREADLYRPHPLAG